ncbi:MAG: redox-sensing transcriptional repressor Rex [Lachnobacterium sp.]|nr:redox-sensing transcriptional repressor Rex [Lachnobacterium sp.]
MLEKEISQAVIRRMPRYYRYLGELLEEGVERISSNDLSRRMRVTASQIRQDLNNFGGFGQQGYGYNVQFLYDEIGKILGLNETHHIIVIGAGNLGQAITNYVKFEKFGFIITALFDVNPKLKGQTVRGIPIYLMDELDQYCKEHPVDIAALTLPKEKADETAQHLVQLGVHAIWNFAHVDLDLSDNQVVVENVHLSDSLMQLSYNIVKNS